MRNDLIIVLCLFFLFGCTSKNNERAKRRQEKIKMQCRRMLIKTKDIVYQHVRLHYTRDNYLIFARSKFASSDRIGRSIKTDHYIDGEAILAGMLAADAVSYFDDDQESE